MTQEQLDAIVNKVVEEMSEETKEAANKTYDEFIAEEESKKIKD